LGGHVPPSPIGIDAPGQTPLRELTAFTQISNLDFRGLVLREGRGGMRKGRRPLPIIPLYKTPGLAPEQWLDT